MACDLFRKVRIAAPFTLLEWATYAGGVSLAKEILLMFTSVLDFPFWIQLPIRLLKACGFET